MDIPRVLNKYTDDVHGAVYIGRPSYWGNPFVVGVHGERGECIAKYEDWLLSQPVKVGAVKKYLKGKDLYCYCAPKACHGDVLLRIANEAPQDRSETQERHEQEKERSGS